MAWQEPKTDWQDGQTPTENDLNRIEGDIKHLHENVEIISWTPAIAYTPSVPSTTYKAQTGIIIKIDNTVTVWFNLDFKAVGGGNSKYEIKVTGLPYDAPALLKFPVATDRIINIVSDPSAGDLPAGFIGNISTNQRDIIILHKNFVQAAVGEYVEQTQGTANVYGNSLDCKISGTFTYTI